MNHSTQTKERLSEMRRGDKNPFYGKKHSEETKAKLRIILREHKPDGQLLLSEKKIVLPESTNDLAYLAAMLDGEGSIKYRKIKRGLKPFVAVYNTSKVLIGWLKEIGGSVSVDNRGRTPTYCWTIQASRDVFALLVAVKPYLIIKRHEAEEMIKHLYDKYGEAIYG